MEFKIGDKVYYPHPIINIDNEVSDYEIRIGTIKEICQDHKLFEIISNREVILNVKFQDIRLLKSKIL